MKKTDTVDPTKLVASIERTFALEVVPALMDYVRIPAKSVAFDPDWHRHGYLHDALRLMERWVQRMGIPELRAEIIEAPEHSPVLFVEVPGDLPVTVMLYGHADKQPEFTGWRSGLAPWEPILQDGRLYGRGAADDGYAFFSALTAIAALVQQGLSRPRCVVLIETSEESGSCHLPLYLEKLRPRLGAPSAAICLDADTGDFERLWLTRSLRGVIEGTLTVEVLTEGVHSGNAGGVVPDPFYVLRRLLERLQPAEQVNMAPGMLWVRTPGWAIVDAMAAALLVRRNLGERIPWRGNAQPLQAHDYDLILANAWQPALTITGLDGLPPVANAGNVIVPRLRAKLSIRVPPLIDATLAAAQVKVILERDPPFQVGASFTIDASPSGWAAEPLQPALDRAVSAASLQYFGKPSQHHGAGGTIPFVQMLQQAFPDCDMIVTGVLGPGSNAHGPNEFLHVDMARRLTCCVAELIHTAGQK